MSAIHIAEHLFFALDQKGKRKKEPLPAGRAKGLIAFKLRVSAWGWYE
jgi:hypothetical protein